MRQQHLSEIVRVPGGYGKLPSALSPQMVAWLSHNFAKAPFFIRLLPDFLCPDQPPMPLTEAAVAPTAAITRWSWR